MSLKPCPFCGSNIIHRGGIKTYRNACEECGASTGHWATQELVDAAWNRRASDGIAEKIDAAALSIREAVISAVDAETEHCAKIAEEAAEAHDLFASDYKSGWKAGCIRAAWRIRNPK